MNVSSFIADLRKHEDWARLAPGVDVSSLSDQEVLKQYLFDDTSQQQICPLVEAEAIIMQAANVDEALRGMSAIFTRFYQEYYASLDSIPKPPDGFL